MGLQICELVGRGLRGFGRGYNPFVGSRKVQIIDKWSDIFSLSAIIRDEENG